MSDELSRLGKRIADLEELVENLLISGVGLGRSSFDNGQINQYSDGALGGSFGTQFDGTNGAVTLNGPPPPTPRWTSQWGAMVEGVVGGLVVRWEGFFEPNDFVIAPLDFKLVEIHVSKSASLDGIVFDTLKQVITTARGGEVLIPLPVDADGYYVRLTARSHSGQRSTPSTVIGPFYPMKIREEDLGFDLADLAGTQIFWGDVEPTTEALGDLWLKLPEEEAYRWEPGGWTLVTGQTQVVAALKEAIGTRITEDGSAGLSTGDALALVATARELAGDAQELAEQAQASSAAASALATLAKNTADGKITVYRQASVPEGGVYGQNDLWIDIDADNQLFAWTGAWTLVADQRISTALATAQGKTTVFAQASAPTTTGRTLGDVWIDTDDRNIQYVWDGAWTIRRDLDIATALTNANAAATTANAANTLAGQAQTTANGKVTIFRQSAAPSGGTYKVNGDMWLDSDDGKIYIATTTSGGWTLSDDQRIATALTAANTANTTVATKIAVFSQTSAPTTTGRTVGDVWIDTDDGNKWYDWTGAWTARTWGATAISATARQLGAITTYRQATAPATGMLSGDFWIDSDDNKIHRYDGSTWVVSQDAAINTAITNAATALSTADGKMRIFPQATAPTGLVAGDAGDMWIDTDDSNVTYTWSGAAWNKHQIGNGAIAPNSLVASDVIATGTVSAALLNSILVLATTIVAGNPDLTHVKISPTGVYAYADDPVDGVPNEVIRMGTETNDYFGITGSDGMLRASMDDTGAINGRTGNFREDVTVAGRTLTQRDWNKAWGLVATAQKEGGLLAVSTTTSIGLLDCGFTAIPGRAYRMSFADHVVSADNANMELRVKLRMTVGNPAPAISVNSQTMAEWNNSHDQGRWMPASAYSLYYFAGITVPTEVRLLTTLEVNTSFGGQATLQATRYPFIMVEDVGPAVAFNGSVNRGGGTQGAPVRQYDTGELVASGWETYRGDGTLRNDVSGPTQGWDPSGYNGNGKGRWWWNNLPSITGTVDRVDVYLQAEHWYYNSGGTARLNAVPSNSSGSGFVKTRGDWDVPGFPKPGGKWFTLPADWFPLFHNNGAYGYARVNSISVGPGPGTDLNYYGRFLGSAARVRIWYTQ